MDLVKINASDYGLEENKAKQIEEQFKPMLAKMTELEKEYNEVIKLDINDPETSIKAYELRRKYVKVRTGTAEIHKAQKAFYLAGGRFVDGWKNAQIFASQNIEESLMNIEKHFENIEKERIAELQIKRASELEKYECEIIPGNVGEMEESVWNNYLTGVKTIYENQKEAERVAEIKRKEIEYKEMLQKTRESLLRSLWEFVPEKHPPFGELSEDEWDDFLQEMKNAKEDYDLKQEKVRKENKRLQKEAREKEIKRLSDEKIRLEKEEKERKKREEREEKQEAIYQANLEKERKENDRLKKEAKKKQKIEEIRILREKKRNNELRPYIVFIRDYTKMLNLKEKEYQKELSDIKKGAELQWEYDRKEAIKKEKIEKELQEKREAEQQRLINEEKERKAAEKAAKLAPDKDKLIQLSNDITAFKLPEMSSDETKEIIDEVISRITDIVDYLNDKISEL